MPFWRAKSPRHLMSPSLLAFLCTPHASFGWLLYLFTSQRRNMWHCASLLCLWPSGIFCPVWKWVQKYWKSFLFSLSATVTIACLFIPKLYIIVLHPEKNVRQSMMNHSKYQSTHHQSIKANGPASLNGGGPTSLSQKCNGMYYVQMYVHCFWKSHFVPKLNCTWKLQLYF